MTANKLWPDIAVEVSLCRILAVLRHGAFSRGASTPSALLPTPICVRLPLHSPLTWLLLLLQSGFTKADAHTLKTHYKRILKPFLDFETRRKAGDLPADKPRATIHEAAHPAALVTPATASTVPYTASIDPKVQRVFSTTAATPAADDFVAQACRDMQARPIASSSASTSSTACSSPTPPLGLLARPKLAKAVPRTLAHMPLIMRAVAATAATFVTGDSMDTSQDSDEDDYAPPPPQPRHPANSDDDNDDDESAFDPAYTATHRDLRLSPVVPDSNRITLSHGGTRPPAGEVEAELGDEACEECRIGDFAELMLLCDTCDRVRRRALPVGCLLALMLGLLLDRASTRFAWSILSPPFLAATGSALYAQPRLVQSTMFTKTMAFGTATRPTPYTYVQRVLD